MAKPKPLTKEQIVAAMSQTKSNRACARYLNCSYMHYKRYAKMYKDENGVSLFDKHKNQSGKGIPKFLNNSRKMPALMDIIEGRVPMTNFKPEKIKNRLITEGYLKEECYCCGFHERRLSDYKIPLILDFIDKNKGNYRQNNVRLLCYNCYYLQVGDLFTNKQIEGLEDHVTVYNSEVDWELDDYQKQRLQELGLYEPPKSEDDGSEFISRA
jgi:hypothetical protein